MNIALVEDEQLYQDKFLEVVAALPEADLTVTCFDSGAAFLFQLPDAKFDAVFLGIKLAEAMNGMAVAKKIRLTHHDLPLIFLSNYDDYVFDGYDVGALGYIMKPVTVEKLSALLKKITTRTEKPTLIVKTDAGLTTLPLFDILYFEVNGHSLKIVTQQDTYFSSATLSSLADQLPENFLSIHRSYKVNLAQVATFDGQDVLMKDGTRLPVARSQKKIVKAALLAHYRRLARDDQ